MNKCKFYIFLPVLTICLMIVCSAFAGSPPEGWCDSCCSSSYGAKGQCTGCSCGSSGDDGGEGITIVAIPEDHKGGYYIENGEKKYIQYRTWANCMNDIADPDKCGRLVTNDCESCMGGCQSMQLKGEYTNQSCASICKNSCSILSAQKTASPDSGMPPAGEDEYGTFYYEGGQKKYSGFHNFGTCWAILSDVKGCVSKYGYGCRYTDYFYMTHLCEWTDYECLNRISDEYNKACR